MSTAIPSFLYDDVPEKNVCDLFPMVIHSFRTNIKSVPNPSPNLTPRRVEEKKRIEFTDNDMDKFYVDLKKLYLTRLNHPEISSPRLKHCLPVERTLKTKPKAEKLKFPDIIFSKESTILPREKNTSRRRKKRSPLIDTEGPLKSKVTEYLPALKKRVQKDKELSQWENESTEVDDSDILSFI